MNRSARVPGLLLAVLALTITGCGGRKTEPPSEVAERPAAEVTPAPGSGDDTAGSPRFDATAGRDPAVWSGDLPLGDEPPEISAYDQPPGWDLGPDANESSPASGADELASPAVQALFADVLFGFDSFRLAPADRRRLAETGSFLREHPGWSLLLEGHCDERGDAAYNLALGEKRALTVREFLASTGVAPGVLSTVSYGEERPLVRAHDDEAWARNRRVHFRVRRP